MRAKELLIVAMMVTSTALSVAHAGTQWSTQDYDLYAGDFNGDGKTDILYIAKSSANASGIDLSDGNGPNIPLQSWPSNYLGIPWYGNQFMVIVADFNGDGRADILLQAKTPGDSYLLLTNGQGMITGITQAIPSSLASLGWSADQHRVIAGDFNKDGRADLFLQATSPSGTNAIFLAEASGQFAAADLAEQWSDGYLGFNWATTEALVYAGDFNGDGYADLLIQARPKWTMIDYDVPFPVPIFPPNMDGVVLAQPSAPIFQAAGLQAWSRKAFGADWSPLVSSIVVGNFDGSHGADVILQGKNANNASDLITGNATGTSFSNAVPLASNVSWTADAYRLLAADFSGSGTAGVYLQSLVPSGANYYATGITASSASVTPQAPVIANELIVYTYDALGRLVTVAHSGAANNNMHTTYSYDSAGNRTTVAVTGAP
jgi:YD repeat-containing protein